MSDDVGTVPFFVLTNDTSIFFVIVPEADSFVTSYSFSLSSDIVYNVSYGISLNIILSL